MEGPMRRPIAARSSTWASRTARWLARRGLRPNQISLLSIVFAAIAGVALAASANTTTTQRVVLLVVAAACIPLRLLCNLFDGMLAVEGGMQSPTGELYNELPDRVADTLIMVGAGYAGGPVGIVTLGWLAALMAVMVAYVRALGAAAGAQQHFLGPMAKPTRMHVMIGGCLFAVVETVLGWPPRVLPLALLVVVIGGLITIARRLRRIAADLEAR